MKTSNIRTDHNLAIWLGRSARFRAGFPGVTFRDSYGNESTANDISVVGAVVTDGDNETGVLTVGTTAGAPGSTTDWFNVQDYGAVGDGSTDDTAAIQAAIDAAKLNGGVVYFPQGTYKITSVLNVDPATGSHHIRFLGTIPPDMAATTDAGSVIVQATNNTGAFSCTTNAYDTVFEHLKIYGPATHASGDGIYSVRNVHCNDVWIARFANGLHIGSSGFYSKQYRLMVYGCTTGVQLDGSANNADFFASRITTCTTGLNVAGCASLAWYGGSIEGCTTGVKLDSGTYITEGVIFSGCYFENSGGTDLRIGHSATVFSVTIQGCYFNPAATWHIDAQYVDGLTISGNSLGGGTGSHSKIRAQSPAANVVIGYNDGSGAYGTLPATTIRVDPSQTLTPSATAAANAAGSGPDVAYKDHVHQSVDSTAPSTSAVGDAAAAGSATLSARRDHVHGREAFGAVGNSAVGDSASNGVATTEARSDHRHGREAFGSPVATGPSNSDGTATTVARSDHVHQGSDGSGAHGHTVDEVHLSDGASTTHTLDAAFEPGTVMAWNKTTLAYLDVTEIAPDQVTVSAAGAAGDKIAFSYATVLA